MLFVAAAAMMFATLFQDRPSPTILSVPPDTADRRAAVEKSLYDALFLLQSPPGPGTIVIHGHVRPLRSAGLRMGRNPCGMPIIVGDAKADPKMIVVVPESTQRAAPIRSVEPNDCWNK